MKDTIYIALGSNLHHPQYGDPSEVIDHAIRKLAQDIMILSRSPIYRSRPVPFSDQPDYANAVIRVASYKNPFEMLVKLHSLEDEMGRVRYVKNEARVLDLDLLDYDSIVLRDAKLQLPHERIKERSFVLYPLRDVAPNWTYPGTKETVDDLIRLLPRAEIRLWR